MAVTMKKAVFLVVTLCSSVKVRRRFGGKWMHFWGGRVSWVRNLFKTHNILISSEVGNRYLSLYGSTALCCTLAAFSVSYTQSVGHLGRGSALWKAATWKHKHKINAHIHAMPGMGLEPTTAVFERAKTVHALDRASTVIGSVIYVYCLFTYVRSVHLNMLLISMSVKLGL
jgi:hypothetical protein